MKQHRSWFVAPAVAVGLALGVAGCGDDKPASSTSTTVKSTDTMAPSTTEAMMDHSTTTEAMMDHSTTTEAMMDHSTTTVQP